MPGEGQTGGFTDALKAGVNYLTGSSNTTAIGSSPTHQDGVDHIKNRLNDRGDSGRLAIPQVADPNLIADPNTISTPGLSSQGTLGTSRDDPSVNTTGNITQSGLSQEGRPQTLPTSGLEQRERERGHRGDQTGLPQQVADSYRSAPDVAPRTTGSAEAIHDKREVQQELESIVAQPAPATSEGVGHGPGTPIGSDVTGMSQTGSSHSGAVAPQSATGTHGLHGNGYPAVGTEQTVTGIHSGAYSDNGVRGGGVGITNQGGAPIGLTNRTRNDPAFDKSGHSQGSDLTAGAASGLSNSTRNDPAHDPSGTFAPVTSTRTPDVRGESYPHVGSAERDGYDHQNYTSEHHTSALGASAGGAGLAAGVAGAEVARDHDNTTTRKERTDLTDTATDKLRRDPAHSGNDDAVLGSSAVGRQASRGERGTSGSNNVDTTAKERTDPTYSATEKLSRDPTHSASDDHVLGSDAQGQQSSRGEQVDPEQRHKHVAGHKHEPTSSGKDDPYWQGKETAREHLEHEAREGRSVKENPDSIPTAGGEKLGSKHWGESQKLPE